MSVAATKHPMLDVEVRAEGSFQKVKFSSLLGARSLVHFSPAVFSAAPDVQHFKGLVGERKSLEELGAQVLFITHETIQVLEFSKRHIMDTMRIPWEERGCVTMVSDCDGVLGKTIPGLLFAAPNQSPMQHNRACMIFVKDELKQDIVIEKTNTACDVTSAAKAVAALKLLAPPST